MSWVKLKTAPSKPIPCPVPHIHFAIWAFTIRYRSSCLCVKLSQLGLPVINFFVIYLFVLIHTISLLGYGVIFYWIDLDFKTIWVVCEVAIVATFARTHGSRSWANCRNYGHTRISQTKSQ